jgi:zinc transporter 9
VALGSSAGAPAHVGLAVFAAVALHRAPAAVGLTATLLKLGVTRRAARAHLAFFAIAAPVGALVAWVAVAGWLGRNAAADDAAGKAGGAEPSGSVLVFSGATFLWVFYALHGLDIC